MEIYCTKEISIENNDNIYFLEDYLDFVIENETSELTINKLIKPRLYIFDENRRITVLEWYSSSWEESFVKFRSIFKTYTEEIGNILGYSIVWQSSSEEINIIMKYADEYEEVFENKAYIYKFSNVADYIIREPLRPGIIRQDFFQLI